jgi:preprotein translocase subunit SecF
MEIIKPGTQFDFLGKTKVAVTFSAIVCALIWILVPFRVNLGVDFAGGTEIEVKFNQTTSAEQVREKVEAAGFPGANVQQYGSKDENSYLVRVERISVMSPEQAKGLQDSLQTALAPYGVQSIDFDPNVGAKVDIRTEKPVPADVLRGAVQAANVPLTQTGEAIRDLTRAGQPSYQLVTQGLSDKVSAALRASFGEGKVEVRRVEYVGPQVGAQLRNRGIMAVLLSMGAILLYVAFRFQPKFAPGGVIALFHDCTFVMAYYVVTGAEFDLNSIAVLLTIIGYSINDTIVIFDRVREVEGRKTGRSLTDIINSALNETLSRTLITSGVTALSLLGLLVFGVGTLWDFAAAMLVGMISGTYSTIYIASPVAVWIDNWMKRREAAQAAAGKPNKPKPSSKRATASAD